MNREEKSQAVAELSDRLKEADSVFAVDYRGISVTQAAELRRNLAEADAVFTVVKNRLAKLSAADAGTDGLDELFVGPTALTLIKGDAVIAAKAISNFAREHEVLEYKGGLMDGEALDPDSFKAIARLPGLEVLHGQLTGLAASPITGLVRGLGSMISGLAIALGQIAEQGLVSGEAPAEEEAPEEPAAEAESEVPAAAEEAESQETAEEEQAPAEEDAPAEEAPAEQAEAAVDEQADAEAQAEALAEEASEEEQEQESQPEEPAADAEAEGSEE